MKNQSSLRRRLITFGRILKTGGSNFLRNAWLSVAATAVMVVALTIILLAVVLNETARGAITELSKNLKVSVYFKEGVTQQQRLILETAIKSNPYTAEVDYISMEQAQQQFTQRFQNDQKLIDGLLLVGGETLPASLEVSVNNLDKINEVANIATDPKYADVVESITLGKTDAKKTIDRAASAQRFILGAGILSAAIFSAVSVLIIFNTIRMAIFTRSEEIRIMKLIGATPSYIRGPFLVEASIYGVIAGCISIAAVYSLILLLGSKVASQAEFAQTYSYFAQTSTMLSLLFRAILIGVAIGITSSLLAMAKYLRLKKW